jgi:hypothetical protein
MKSPGRWLTVGAVVLLVACFVAVRQWRHANAHVETVLTTDYLHGVDSDESIRAELEAAGPVAVDELRAELRRQLTWADRLQDQALSWLKNQGASGLNDPRRSPSWVLPRRKQRALNALMLLGERAASARPEIEALQGRSGDLGNAMSTLCALSPNDPRTISNVVATLQNGNQPERFFLAGNFAKIWTNPPAHLWALVSRLKDSDDGVRARAVRNLASYGPQVSHVLPQLLPLLDDPSPTVRPPAAYALGHVVPTEAPRAIQAMLAEQEANDPARTSTGWIDLEPYRLYVELGPLARAAVPRLEQELADPAYASKAGPIAFALWRITGDTSPRIIGALTKGAESRLERFKLFSLSGLKQIGPPASNAVPALQRVVLDERVLVHRLAQEALQSVTQPPQTNP